MFKKKPQIKNLAPLRSSDRRKLADQIIAEYQVTIPPSTTTDGTEPPSGSQTTAEHVTSAPTLTSIRASLIPETCLSARFTTHAGASATLVSGTIYVGSFPGQEERILWIQYGKDARLYPTVYTLWQNPGLVPLLYTPDFVVEKLRTGADLMTPGLFGGPPWPKAASLGAVVAVAGLEKESVPVWVGVCKIDVSSLGKVQGLKGAAVEGVHWEGDELWSWSHTGSGGRPSPDRLEGWEAVIQGLTAGIDSLDVEDQEDDGGVALDASSANPQNGHVPTEQTETGDIDSEVEPEREPTTAEVDQAFQEAFLYSLHNAKKNGVPPSYGLDLPMLPSYLISKMIQPHLRHQNPNYTIKKSSWKNTKKFIKHLDKQQIVKSKDRNGGETVILDIDFSDQQLKDFKPYRLPKPKPTNDEGNTESTSSSSDPSIGQTLTLQTLYRASSKVVPELLPSKTTFYTSGDISTFLQTYITNNPDLTTPANVSSKRYIKLNPFLANNILTPTNASDTRILAAGEIARDALLTRLLSDSHLLIPHWLLLRPPQSYPDTPNLKPRPHPSPHALLTLETRTGNKTITRISGLEPFGINPQVLGPELQRKCAGAASVGQLVGGKPGVLEITVQGDQRDVVRAELVRRGVKGEWVEVVDKTKKGRKK